MLAGTLYRHRVILLLNNTKPLHIITAEKVRFWLKTAQQREITPAPLYTGGSCITGGVTSMVILCLPSI